MSIKTAELCDREIEQARVCLAPWRSFGQRSAVSGHVSTLRTYEDAALLRQQLGLPGEGRVLVVDAGGSMRAAVLGDNMARLGAQNGWAGVLIYGAIRDVDELAEIDWGIFALGSVPLRGGKQAIGECDVEVSIEGIFIRPGEFIAIDADGVVVLSEPPAS